jgi:hypothetical protein
MLEYMKTKVIREEEPVEELSAAYMRILSA